MNPNISTNYGSGLPVAISAGSATPHEVSLVEATIDARFTRERPQRLIGDKAYDSDELDRDLRAKGVEKIAPHRENRVKPPTQDGRALRRYKRRWTVERLFAWLGNFLPFHWNEGEENGMIDSLKRWCSAEREAMLDELQTIGKGRGEYGKTPWIYPSIYSVSHSMAALAFVEGGWPVWHKQDILRRVGGRFPEYLDSFSRAYDYKSTTPGRRRFIELVTQEPAKLLNELKSLTDDLSDLVDSIWGEIMLALKSDRSKIPMNITNWKERNDEIYAEFMIEYLRLS